MARSTRAAARASASETVSMAADLGTRTAECKASGRGADDETGKEHQQPREAIGAETRQRILAVVSLEPEDLRPEVQRHGQQRDERKAVGPHPPQSRRPEAKR